MTQLVTDRLVLRRARLEDAAALHEAMSDPEAMRYWSTPPHDDLSQTRDFVAAMVAAPADASDEFVVEHAGVVIGKLGAWRLPELGFIFARPAWGKGFASEALAAFIGHAAGRHDHLTADVDPRNAASLRVLARAGFRVTGTVERTLLVGEEWCDSVFLRRDL